MPPAPGTVHVALASDGRAAGEARRATKATLVSWRLPGLMDAVVLAVSELVGNAVRHGLPPIALTLRRRKDDVRIDVHDEHHAGPAGGSTVSGTDGESGRGMFLVDAVSDDMGVDFVPGDGKNVYASFRTDGAV